MGLLKNKVSRMSTCLWLCWIFFIVSEIIGITVGLDTDWTDGLENLEAEVGPEDMELIPPSPQPEREATTLRCHRRVYKAQVEQKDQEGRRCWDTVSFDACWGRCDSHEISEWKFPYKRSKHPVCGFGARVEKVVRLQHCEEGAAPEARIYKHVHPLTCRCRACSSADTSCGWLPLH